MALWAAVVACGCGDGGSVTDASIAGDSASPEVVRVVVSPTLSPPSSAPAVYFQAADSTLVLATRADGMGRANAFMPPHGFVTVVEQFGPNVDLYTYTDVSPGDVLFVHPPTGTPTALTIRAPERAPGTTYEVLTACADQFSSSPTTQLALTGCEPATDVLVLPDSSTYSFADNVTLGEGQEVELPPYRAFEPATLDIVGVPSAATGLSVDHGLALGARMLSTGEEILVGSDGAVHSIRSLPLAAGGVVQSIVRPAPDDRGPAIVSWQPASPSVVVDYSAETWRALATNPLLGSGEAAIGWDESSPSTEPSAFYARLDWQQAGMFRWEIVAPRAKGQAIALPVLPIASLRPSDAASLAVFQLAPSGHAVEGLQRILGTWQPDPGRDWPTSGDAGRVAWRQMIAP